MLLDSDFAGLPPVLAEGRRVIANVERVANLFVTKTVYATLLALVVGVAGVPFPFLPRHLTIISSLTIGIPAFFLALAPNDRRARPGFVGRVLRFAVPAGVLAATATMVSYGLARAEHVPPIEARTTATITLFIVALWVLAILARPTDLWRFELEAAMAACSCWRCWCPGPGSSSPSTWPIPRSPPRRWPWGWERAGCWSWAGGSPAGGVSPATPLRARTPGPAPTPAGRSARRPTTPACCPPGATAVRPSPVS